MRFYGGTEVIPSAASLFFVSADGWAITCRHVAQNLAAANQLLLRADQFRAEKAQIPLGKHARRLLRALEQKYDLKSDTPFEAFNLFVNCVEGSLDLEVMPHPTVDLALLHFKNYTKLLCDEFPVLAQHDVDLKQGKFLCRLGFPFPEFTNFEYDAASDTIRWANTGRQDTPRFPIEGMLTRHVTAQSGELIGFELSTPGLKGQSGGPAFDRDGRVWGMQASTGHLDLDFDVDVEVRRGAAKRRVRDSAFLHVGHCVHIRVIKEFLRSFGVTFQEG